MKLKSKLEKSYHSCSFTRWGAGWTVACYTDNITATIIWQEIRQNASDFVKQYKEAGGKVILVDLSKEGIKGNTHFMFQDKNSDTVAKNVGNWIDKNADR